ncbi:hypothetical protein E1180_01375 [Roseibium denhamense]|uniref:Uncharacterized protein n=1 Tax=Roseibium denhamense TaxID=76305 RepID=A0ABY1NEB3_9HYPH|nr:hypothetical protein [Roseibium denhamense]MTI04167.1 hypothetical protein [Roseibium denhamense]SMP07305.1 hypothetical protein SAMN06265374_0857 [Roseibium denhamense]
MVFNTISFWLLVLAVPLWAMRWRFYGLMSAREKQIFKRLVSRRHESGLGFAARIFGFLVALAAAVITLVLGLRYLKHGTVEIGAYKEVMRSRIYSGVEPVDQALDIVHYNQLFPIAVLTTCAVLSIAFALVATGLRDISTINRLRRRVERLQN